MKEIREDRRTNVLRPADIVAGVLIGGQSRRMGVDKASLRLPDGATMLEHVVNIARCVAGEVVLLGNLRDLPAAIREVRVLPDPTDGKGPAAGLVSLLNHAGKRWGLLLACDLPRLSVDSLRPLLPCLSDDVDAVAYLESDAPTCFQACCAFYHPRILAEVHHELNAGRGCLQNVLARVRVRAVPMIPFVRDAIVDVDTPEDWNAIMKRKDS